MVVLKNVNVFTGDSDSLLVNQEIIIDNDIIKEIRPASECAFENDEVLDLTGCTLTPGFIECHMHPFMHEITQKDLRMGDSRADGTPLPNKDFYTAYRGVAALQKALWNGFTTVYDGGGINNMDIALRDAINLGYIEGPDYYTVGQQITAWPTHHKGLGKVAAGPWGMREAVRERLFWAVDMIKIENSAPARAYGRTMEKSAFTIEELQACTDEAHSAGLLVQAHARGAVAVVNSVKGGCDIVVHGTGINEEGLELMVKNNTWLYTTLAIIPAIPDPEWQAYKPTRVGEMLKRTGLLQEESLKKAYKAGIRMALASDWGLATSTFGQNAREMLQMKRIGMSNFECLQVGTSNAADSLGQGDRIGRIKAGYKADFAGFMKNPLEELEVIMNPAVVIKSGKVIRNEYSSYKENGDR